MHDLDRRAFLTLTTLAAAGLATRSAKGAPVENLEELTIADMRRYSARELTAAYLARIDSLDKRTVNSMIELNPDALAIADALDRERAAGRVRAP